MRSRQRRQRSEKITLSLSLPHAFVSQVCLARASALPKALMARCFRKHGGLLNHTGNDQGTLASHSWPALLPTRGQRNANTQWGGCGKGKGRRGKYATQCQLPFLHRLSGPVAFERRGRGPFARSRQWRRKVFLLVSESEEEEGLVVFHKVPAAAAAVIKITLPSPRGIQSGVLGQGLRALTVASTLPNALMELGLSTGCPE